MYVDVTKQDAYLHIITYPFLQHAFPKLRTYMGSIQDGENLGECQLTPNIWKGNWNARKASGLTGLCRNDILCELYIIYYIYYIISYYIILYYIISYYIILYYIISYYITYIISYYIIYHTILYHIILYYIILYYLCVCVRAIGTAYLFLYAKPLWGVGEHPTWA